VLVHVAGLLGSGAHSAASASSRRATAATVVTPGSFTGYGFDQCTAPSQTAMNAWLNGSPYWAVGIYISGDSRGCTSQPHLTPTWVRTQLANGWRLLPITLGPQAWCTTRQRYLHQVRISPSRTDAYAPARKQGRAEAEKTTGVARQLGIAPGSTLWYDLEAFDTSKTDCRESALSFLSAWTNKLHRLGYQSGAYSSAASGIRMLDSARVNRPGTYAMPDQLWIADWNGRADVHTSYISDAGWMPHRRVHQYRVGHDEKHGGVTINIDSDWVDLGRGSSIAAEPRHCHGAAGYNFASYGPLRIGSTGALVKSLQCQLTVRGLYHATIDGRYDAGVGEAVKQWRARRGLAQRTTMSHGSWMVMLSQGAAPLMKYGAASTAVRRLQRTLNAADGAGLAVTGIFEGTTTKAVKAYQRAHSLSATGVVTTATWQLLQRGVR
jgi:peptidoglycan hydrolase-like protein with peptidoglycan-binding domain